MSSAVNSQYAECTGGVRLSGVLDAVTLFEAYVGAGGWQRPPAKPAWAAIFGNFVLS